MSEEEKKIFNFLKTFVKTEIDYCKLEKDDVLDILNIIKKQQEKIDELKEKEKNLLKQLKDSEKELLEVTQNVVSKDKIREKIKDLEDNMILFTNDKEKFNRYKYARSILEKLLEEK